MSRFVLTAQLQLQAPTNTAQIVRQIQSQLNNVQVNVQVQGTAQATRQVQQVAQSLNAANSAASNLGRTFAISVKRFTALAVATRAVSLFTNTLANATQEAIDFERQLIKVSQVTGESIADLKFLTKTITGLATGFGVSSKSLLEVSTILLQAGVSSRDTEVALKSLAKAALAPNFDSISETAEGAIAILAQFQKGVGALEGQLSSINAVAGAFAVEAGDLIDVIRRTGGVFKASGGSLNELLALFTSVRATTRESAESIGTGLRTIFTRIQRPKTIEFLKQFGVELVDLEGKFVGPFEAVRRLSQALAGLGERDITFIRIAEELGGFRQIGKVLPLLQQFSTAEEALNVAQKANNGLTKDAQTAQQALAIRITKVKEEFLALVRSITETSSFQFFANTTLNLASALIRLADALKPIIPLLTAVASIKLAQGLSGFIGGFGRGIGSGRTFNEGGKVLKFARGGMVPGSGNRDTVPAMLQPGEFVIRKSSVNKLGAGNLAAMNDNKYAEGGAIKIKPGAIGGFFLKPEEGIDRKGSSVNEIVQIRGVKALSALGAIDSTDPNVRAEVFKSATTAQQSKILGTKLSSKLSDQISIGGGKTKNIFDKNGKFAKGVGLKADANADNRLTKRIESSSIKLNKDSKLTKNVPLSGNITSYFPGASDMEKNSQVSNAISTTTSNALSNAVKEASNQVKTLFNNNRAITPTNAGINTASQRIANDPNAKKTTEGFIFEGLIQGITGALLSGGQSNFDFPFESISFAKSSLRAMFTDSSGEGIDNLIKADAKRSNTPDALNSIVNKLVNDINKGNLLGVEFTKFAKGSSGKGVQSTKKIGKKRGFFFDFDDTLATTGAIERPGTADPYSDFRGEKGRKLLESAAATRYAAMAKRRASEGHDVWVLTARPGDKDTVSGIKTFGAKNGLMFKGVIGVGGSAGKKGVDTATAKSMILSRYAKNYPDGIIFADDLRENILAAQQQMQRSGVPFKSVVAKKYFGGLIQKFASGGGVGTDTVPALLTPGEFVINKKSAQSIGYGSLNRMNKVGKYASGGVVQRFATGGTAAPTYATGAGAMSVGGLMNKIQQERERLEQEQIDKIKAVYKRSYLDIRKIHDEQVADAKASGKSIDDIKKIFEQSNRAIKNLKTDTLAQVKAVKTSTDIQATAKQNIIGPRQDAVASSQNFNRAMASASQGTFNRTDFGTGYDKLTQAQLKQVLAIQKATVASGKAAAADAQEAVQSTNAARADASQATSSNRTSSMFGGLGGGITLVTASLQSLLPPLDENSGLLLKFSHSIISTLTVIGSLIFALEAFGVALNKQTIISGLSSIGSILSGGLGTVATGLGATAGKVAGSAAFAGGLSASSATALGTAVSGATSALVAVAAPAIAAAATFYVIQAAGNALVESFMDYEGRIKKAKEGGDVEKTRQLATEQQSAKRNVNIAAGATAGAVAGFILTGGNPIGAAVGAAIAGTVVAAFSDLPEYAGHLAASQAAQIASTKALTKATEDSAKAMQEFEKGNISAIDVLKSTSSATEAAAKQRKEAEALTISAEKNKSNVIGNTLGGAAAGALTGAAIGSIVPIVGTAIGAAVGAGIGGISSYVASNRRNARIDAEVSGANKEATKAEEDAFKAAQPGLQLLQRQVAATGGSFQDFMARVKEGNPVLADYIHRQGAGTLGLTDSFENLRKEAERTRAAFNAMDLGFQKISAVSGALSVGLENYLASQEAGNIGIENNIRTLEASITNAAQGISDTDFQAALGGARAGLEKLGASENQIKKFEENLGAINTAQKFYAQASEQVKNKLVEDFRAGRGADLSAVGKREKFADVIGQQLANAGIGDEAKKRISDAIKGANIEEADLNKILEGDLSVLDKVLKDLGETTLNQVIGPLKELAKYEKVLVDVTKKRIEAENNLISAQRGVLDAQLEAQEIISKYGGPALTPQIRTQNAIAQANIQTQGTRVSALRTGSAAELNQRNRETRQRLIEIGNVRTAAAAGNVAAQQQLQGRGGAELEAEQKRLQELAKSDYETTKLLIKNKEEELKLVQEKNKLEKDSIDALVSGDMEKFFEQQAAAGAQAAIALGSDRLQGAFGASALGAAAQDIRRQQEAGQQTLFGQQLAGPGGLTERAFGAAIGARGITDPRLAQIASGTTAEESGVEAQIRELAATLPNYAQTQLESSQQELYASQWQVQAAEMQLQAAKANVEARSGGAPIAGMAKGGVVYANRGIFVPRGTDTVPAMLTPGEFVVRREAVQRGNNLQLLQSMNRGQSQGSAGTATGMARGGVVNQTQYLAFGGFAKAVSGLLDGDFVGKLTQSFNTFISEMSKNIDKLNSTNFTMKLDTTNVNVNLNGGSFLNKMKDELREELMKEVASKIQNYKAGEGGSLKENRTVLG